LRYLADRLSQVVKVTLEVPESILGDIYVAVGGVLEADAARERERCEADHGARQKAAPEPGESNQVPAEA
jgi:hypothetical protein